ncbi:hypothetical protein HYPSUDRAFT_207916 [Hypholoma sublateritium FD-334 SS-4]|uniref:SNF2 N-terminal domain-containing protein n=1 Tax=Hypholoma sublateritium (strain FD-334 SS-4) TaxID=945553 RepID=A0A0D2KL65_HYPSF|nr:hypothetical protein HYPSUDRAFT_207916 [Hypholoma sublateritium FD-334 SS-4]
MGMVVEEEKSKKVVEATQNPQTAMSRNKAINVYVGVTEMQHKWYRSVLEKDINAVSDKSGAGHSQGLLLGAIALGKRSKFMSFSSSPPCSSLTSWRCFKNVKWQLINDSMVFMPSTEEDTPEDLEQERLAAQEFIDTDMFRRRPRAEVELP